MSRAEFTNWAVDEAGNVVASAAFEVRWRSNNSLVTTVYDAASGVGTVSNPGTATTGGLVNFWLPYGEYEVTIGSGASAVTIPFDAAPATGVPRSFATRAAAVTEWSAMVARSETPPVGTVWTFDGVSIEYDGSTTAISDFNGWKPSGDVYPDHFAENTTPGTTDMLSAIHAAMSYSLNVCLRDVEYFVSDSVNVTRNGVTLASKFAGPGFGAIITIDSSTTVPAIIVGKSDPVAEGRISGVTLDSIMLSGGGNASRTRHAIEVQRGERVKIKNSRCVGFYSGIAFYGGQFNTVDDWNQSGGGTASVIAGTSGLKVDNYDLGSGSYEPSFTVNISNFFLSSGTNLGTAYAFEILSSDGLEVTQGYCAKAGTAMVTLGPTVSGAAAVAYFTNVYFDGVSTSTGAPLGLQVPSGASAGNLAAYFTNCFFGQFAGDIFDVSNTNLASLSFTNCDFANASGNLGTIENGGSSAGRVQFSACRFANAGPLTIGDMESLQMSDCVFDNISGSNAVVISGAFGSKQYDNLSFIGGSGGILDSGTGASVSPVAHWYDQGTYTPAIAFGGGSTGVTYSTQTGSHTKIGTTVFFKLLITLSSKGSSTGSIAITLPSAASDVNALAVWVKNVTAGYALSHTQAVTLGSGSNKLIIREIAASGAMLTWADTALTNTSELVISGNYEEA